MNRIVLALFALIALGASAFAQVVPPGTNPIPGAGAYNSAAPTCTSGQYCALQTDVNGNLKIAIASGGGSGGTASSFDVAFPATGTAIGLSDGTNMKSWLTALIQAKTAVNGNNMGSVAAWLYNAAATSFDAAPGNATDGAWVKVTNTNANGAAAASASSPVTPANQPVGAATFAATQVSVANTATSILAARTGVSGTGRVSATITNTTTTAIYLGGSGVTTSTGQLLPGIIGASVTVNTTAAIYGIVASGTATVTALETY